MDNITSVKFKYINHQKITMTPIELIAVVLAAMAILFRLPGIFNPKLMKKIMKKMHDMPESFFKIMTLIYIVLIFLFINLLLDEITIGQVFMSAIIGMLFVGLFIFHPPLMRKSLLKFFMKQSDEWVRAICGIVVVLFGLVIYLILAGY